MGVKWLYNVPLVYQSGQNIFTATRNELIVKGSYCYFLQEDVKLQVSSLKHIERNLCTLGRIKKQSI